LKKRENKEKNIKMNKRKEKQGKEKRILKIHKNKRKEK